MNCSPRIKKEKKKLHTPVISCFVKDYTFKQFNNVLVLLQSFQFQVMKKDADPTMFFRYYRMTPPKFNELHKLVKRDLVKSFLCREPLCSEERLAITLRYSIDCNMTNAFTY